MLIDGVEPWIACVRRCGHILALRDALGGPQCPCGRPITTFVDGEPCIGQAIFEQEGRRLQEEIE